MSLGVLNNIAAIYAQNNLNNTQSSLQNTLTQLSSGSRINSGADDAAGLAVADGLHANVAALTQSSQNAQNGIGLLQTADGALSQVTNLLNRAVTLATETANGTLTTAQASTANQEYQNILTQIASIGSTTNFNSQNVFSNTARTVFVSDGSAAGANVYSAIVGGLSSASVGQTIAAPITTSAVAPITLAPVAAVANGAGVYTLTPTAAADTISGTFSFRVGATGTVQNITVPPSSTTATLLTQLQANNAFTAAGLTASINGSGVLTITGGTSGANAAANAINFNGTSLVENTVATTGSITNTTTNTAAVNSTAKFTISGGPTSFGGSFTLTQGGTTTTVNIPGGTVEAGSALLNSITSQLTASGTGFTVAETTTGSNPVFTFTGLANSSALTVVSTGITFVGGTSPASADASLATGTAPVAGVKTITLTNATDTFGTGSTLTIGSVTFSGTTGATKLVGLTGTQLAAAINANSTLNTAGISAVFSGSALTITGNATTGAALSVSGTVNDAPAAKTVTNLVTATAATGSAATGATSTITLGTVNDTLSGTLAVTVGTSGLPAQSLSLNVAKNTSGAQLASLINQDKTFQTAGVTASYDAVAGAVTLTGPVGAANTIVTTGTSLVDSSSALAGAGVDFTAAAVATLGASTATTVLTSVTTAIADVAYQRGIIGADVNELNAASGVASSESENLTAAENSLRSTNYGSATSDLAKYKVLSETGISALAQANSVQQEVTKLLQ